MDSCICVLVLSLCWISSSKERLEGPLIILSFGFSTKSYSRSRQSRAGTLRCVSTRKWKEEEGGPYLFFFMTTAAEALLMNVGNSSPFFFASLPHLLFYRPSSLSELNKHTRLRHWCALLCVISFRKGFYDVYIHATAGESIVDKTYSRHTASSAHTTSVWAMSYSMQVFTWCWRCRRRWPARRDYLERKGDTQRDDHQFDLFNEYSIGPGIE